MGYYTGTANDMTALRQALIDACTQPAEGWAWDSVNEVLSKGTMFLRLQVVSGYLTLLGRTSATSGNAPNVVRIGQLGSSTVAFPLTYEIFAFAGEVYMVVNYSVDRYQWCAFGQSTVSGFPGTGMWLGASVPYSISTSAAIEISATSGGASTSSYSRTSAALFWSTSFGFSNESLGSNSWVHSDLDGQGWYSGQGASGGSNIGISSAVPLIGLLPNSWNSEAVLLPIRAYKARQSSKVSVTADLENSRYTRVDNYVPGQVVIIGSERWKIFPWHRKDSINRNAGGGVDHTGTFGWAIRYEGP